MRKKVITFKKKSCDFYVTEMRQMSQFCAEAAGRLISQYIDNNITSLFMLRLHVNLKIAKYTHMNSIRYN